MRKPDKGRLAGAASTACASPSSTSHVATSVFPQSLRWGEASQTEETLSTCRFAQRMGRVTCEITPNVVEESGAKVRALQR